jgi:hypothetical protein
MLTIPNHRLSDDRWKIDPPPSPRFSPTPAAIIVADIGSFEIAARVFRELPRSSDRHHILSAVARR